MPMSRWFHRSPREPAPERAERLTIAVRQTAGGPRVVLAGELDLETAPRLREVVEEVGQQFSGGTLTVDVREVAYIDSAGIAELVRAHRQARRRSQRLLVVRSPDTRIAKVLAMAEDVLAVSDN
jgi:anti-sigma B factor antagonist